MCLELSGELCQEGKGDELSYCYRKRLRSQAPQLALGSGQRIPGDLGRKALGEVVQKLGAGAVSPQNGRMGFGDPGYRQLRQADMGQRHRKEILFL